MLVKTLKKYETLVLESNKGKIEIVIAERNGTQTVVHVYAPKSILISSDMERRDQYVQMNYDKQPETGDYQRNIVKKFASGVGKVDE